MHSYWGSAYDAPDAEPKIAIGMIERGRAKGAITIHSRTGLVFALTNFPPSSQCLDYKNNTFYFREGSSEDEEIQ